MPSTSRVRGGFDTFTTMSFVVALGCSAAYLISINHYAANMPRADDFDMLVAPLIYFLKSPFSAEFWTSIFAKHGEHIVAIPRLAFVAIVTLFGSINFHHLIVAGNMAVPLTALLLAAMGPKEERTSRLVLALPTFFLLTSPHFYQASLWACAVFEHLWVVPWVLIALLLGERQGRVARCVQVLAIALALCTQGNGVFVLLALAFVSYTGGRGRESMMWTVLFLAASLVHVASIPPSHYDSLTEFLVGRILYVAYFLGCAISRDSILSLIASSLMMTLFFVSLRYVSRKAVRLYLSVALFCILTACANALARGHFGVTYPLLQTRYGFPSALFVSATYLGFVASRQSALSRNLTTWCGLVIGALVSCTWWLNITPSLKNHRRVGEEAAASWNISKSGLEHPSQERASSLLRELTERRYFTPPHQHELEHTSQLVEHKSDLPIKLGRVILERCQRGEKGVLIAGYIIPPREVTTPLEITSPVLFSIDSTLPLVASGVSVERPDVERHYRRTHLGHNGFWSLLPLEKVRDLQSPSLSIKTRGSDGRQWLIRSRSGRLPCLSN
jgi:hypothetical protein